MNSKRQVSKDLKEIKIELERALTQLEVLNLEPANVHIRKAINIANASLGREAERRRENDK